MTMRIYTLSDRVLSLIVHQAANDSEASAALNIAQHVLGTTSLQALRESLPAQPESFEGHQASDGPILHS